MPTFERLIRELLKATKQTDKSLQRLQKNADQIQGKYKPRVEFDRWKQTLGGRLWKSKQHQLQNGLCLNCKQPVLLKGAHIDHIKPISRYPNLALDPDNLQILCADCNLTKGCKDLPTG
ncbi:MAG: HNH endonuclease [Phormidesmis sp.]